jgi:lysozyme
MIEQLREELEADEGIKHEVYLDHLEKKTVGIGHLCQAGEPEYEMEVGEAVSEERVAELFEQDMAWTLKDCAALVPEFDELPKEARLIIANMMFNMGRSRLSGFKKFLAAIQAGAYSTAADEMADSRWHSQVPARSDRLIARMRAVS